MIRVNLLNHRRGPVDGLEAAIAASGPSAFINRREILLGVLFLALGAGILFFNSISNRSGVTDPPLSTSASDGVAAAPTPRRTAGAKPSSSRAAQPSEPAPEASPDPSGPPAGAETVLPPPAPADMPGESLGEAAAPASRTGPASPPFEMASSELSALEVSGRGDSLDILATIGGQPPYQMFRLNSPKRMVVDLSGATLSLPVRQRQFTPSHPLVERIRVAQFQLAPPMARMVLEVSEFPEMSVERTPAGLIFKLAPPAP